MPLVGNTLHRMPDIVARGSQHCPHWLHQMRTTGSFNPEPSWALPHISFLADFNPCPVMQYSTTVAFLKFSVPQVNYWTWGWSWGPQTEQHVRLLLRPRATHGQGHIHLQQHLGAASKPQTFSGEPYHLAFHEFLNCTDKLSCARRFGAGGAD